MPKGKPGEPDQEFDDKAAERLRQFEDARKPQPSHTSDTPPPLSDRGQPQESQAPFPPDQKGESEDEGSERSND